MPEHRRKFSPQFKAEAVQMVISTGKPIAEVARDLGIHDGTLGNWVTAWRREHPEPDQPSTPRFSTDACRIDRTAHVACGGGHLRGRRQAGSVVRIVGLV